MSVFKHYARYYDLLYRDKNYSAESNYIVHHLKKSCPEAQSILDLGCGTGRHDTCLAEAGYRIAGIDLSESMIALAEDRRKEQRPELQDRLSFQVGDIRQIHLDEKFDAVISLFHVISYLPENADIQKTFDNVCRHLRPGGLFLFDFWYGPAVLAQKPEVREKELEDDVIRVQRTACPEMKCDKNQVYVHYDLVIQEKKTSQVQKVNETHPMRYLFLPEIRQFLQDARLKFLFAEEWMTGKPPGPNTWGVCCAAMRL